MTKRNSVNLTTTKLEFLLPYDKADPFLEGNKILMFTNPSLADPVNVLHRYLSHRDSRFPTHNELWIKADGSRPRRAWFGWFLNRLHEFFDGNIMGQSLRLGGATTLAERGVKLEQIQPMGRWASDGFWIYILKHPVLLHTIISQSTNRK